MTAVFIALGANLGDAQATVRRAIQALGRLPSTQLVKASSLYKTAPIATLVPSRQQQEEGSAFLAALGGDYINAVVEINTTLAPSVLLELLQKIEHQAGRERSYQDAPRTLDLDLLLYGEEKISEPHLQIPHPRMYQRAFVLVPLHEIAPQHVSAQQLQVVSQQAIESIQDQQ